MSRRVLVLVEGQTEERFVKDVLAPSFAGRNLYFYPTILMTKKVKDGSNFKGGVTNFRKFSNDIGRLLPNAGDAMVTTILDYYGLPTDFPGMQSRPAGRPEDRVAHVERAIAQHFGAPRHFVPFLALHEFEAWLFSSPEELPSALTAPEKQPQFAAICESVKNPEEINERPEYAPSKRIVGLFAGYRKPVHGPATAARIGLDRIKAKCPHFAAWVAQLEQFAAA